jgi:hypothetical protein
MIVDPVYEKQYGVPEWEHLTDDDKQSIIDRVRSHIDSPEKLPEDTDTRGILFNAIVNSFMKDVEQKSLM